MEFVYIGMVLLIGAVCWYILTHDPVVERKLRQTDPTDEPDQPSR